MPTYQNYTLPDLNGSAVGTVGGLFTWANTTTSGGFGLGILVAFFMISLGTMLTFNGRMKGAMSASVFMTTVLAIMLRGMDVVTNDYFVIIGIVMTALSVVWLYYGQD